MSALRKAAEAALEALEGGADSWRLVGPAIDALKAALDADAMISKPEIEHKHEWFRTGAMEPGQIRCIHCGLWGELK